MRWLSHCGRPSQHTRLVALAGTLSASACVAASPRLSEAPAASPIDLVVVATTDVHGRLRGWDYYANAADEARGLTRAATIVDSLRRAAPDRVVLVDAGDLLQGNPLTFVAARVAPDSAHPVIAAMNVMAYDAAAIGNHEFNYGVPLLERAIRQARFPFLAANVYRASGGRAFPAYRIVERGGVRVGIVGATTPGSAVWDRENVHGRLEFRDILTDVREAVAEVRSRGADVVIVVAHTGLAGPSSYDTASTGVPAENVAARIASEVPGVDLVVHGHSHRELADTTIGTAMVMQPRNWATSVAVATLRVERGTAGGARVTSKRGSVIPTAGRAEHPAVLAATEAAHRRTVQYVMAAVGETPVVWRSDSARVRDTPLIDFILEVQRSASGAQLASTAAFSLDASLDAGPITVAEVARLYPYENSLKAVRISGRQLRDYLEFSARYFGQHGAAEPAVDPQVPGYNFDIVAGATYTLDLSKPVGSRVVRLEVGGRSVVEADTFTLALNNYRQSGGGGYAMLSGAPVVYDGQVEIRQLLIDEVRRRAILRPSDVFTRNWEIVPAAAVARAYDEMHRLSRDVTAPRSAGPAARRVRVIATNDFHGALEPRADARGVRRGGAAAMAAVIEQARRACSDGCVSVLVDGGDMFQGTPASNLAFGWPVVELYNALDYSAAALGNHEFDWGVDTLRSRMRQARFRILGANVRFADGRDVPWIPDDTLVDRGGVRIGIVGVAGRETPSDTKAEHVRGLVFADPAPVVDERARALRARGAHVVIVVAHEGAFCDRDGTASCEGGIVDLARRITEPVDAIVSGHTHSVVRTRIEGRPIVQARVSGRAVAIVDIDLAGGVETAIVDVLPDSVEAMPVADSIARRAVAAVAELVGAPVARIAVAMPRQGEQYALGHLIADAQRWAGMADLALINNGGIRAGLAEGTATYGALYEIHPFGNMLVRVSARGHDIRAYLARLLDRPEPRVHVSGATITFDPQRPPDERVLSVTMADGRPLRDSAVYRIVINDFMAGGGEGAVLLGAALESGSLGRTDLDVLIDYLRSRPQPVRPPAGRRLIARRE